MTAVGQEYDLGPRVADWLRRSYPDARAKRVARDHGVSLGTAKRWLRGEPPTAGHLSAMARRWGWRFLQDVFQPVDSDEILAELEAIEALRVRLRGLDRAIARHDGGVS